MFRKDYFIPEISFIKSPKVLSIIIVGSAIIFGIYLRWEFFQAAIVNDWVARDFDRAFNIATGTYLPLAGPELNNGGRLPGPFMYLFLSLPLLIHPSYEALLVFNFILNSASIVMLYFAFKKFFSELTASISVILFSINIHMVTAVLFPINPSYLVFFLVLFVWFFLEMVIGENPKFFPWLVFIICLSVQFHYSMAAFIPVLFLAIIIFKISLTKRYLLISLSIILICFTPYALHQYFTYAPSGNLGIAFTINKPEIHSILSIIKIFAVQNVISSMFNLPSPIWLGDEPTYNLSRIYYYVFSCSFYCLVIITWLQIRKHGVRESRKFLFSLLLFYIPALVYELINPQKLHFWYDNIFVIPQVLIISTVIANSCKYFKSNMTRIVFLVCIACLIINLTYSTVLHVIGNARQVKENLTKGSYKNSKLLLGTFMDELKMNPEKFSKSVYFLGYYPSSNRRLKFVGNETARTENKKKIDSNSSCFLIVNPSSLNASVTIRIQAKKSRFKLFLEDRNIKILGKKIISFVDKGFPETFEVYEYKPLKPQSCYTNGFNPFVVTKDIRNLLTEAKDMSFYYSSWVGIKSIYNVEKYDEYSKLVFLENHYLVINRATQAPFKFKLILQQKNDVYSLRGEIETYYFWGNPDFYMKELDVVITPYKESIPLDGGFFRFNNNEGHLFNILSAETLASSLNFNTFPYLWTYNRNWYREVNFPKDLKLIKNNFFIDLFWIMDSGWAFKCCTNVSQKNYHELKTVKLITDK